MFCMLPFLVLSCKPRICLWWVDLWKRHWREIQSDLSSCLQHLRRENGPKKTTRRQQEHEKNMRRTWEEHDQNSSQKDSPKRFSQEILPRDAKSGSKGIQINKTSAPIANNHPVWTLGSSELTSAAAAAETQPWKFSNIATWTKQNQRLNTKNTSEQNQVVRQNSII